MSWRLAEPPYDMKRLFAREKLVSTVSCFIKIKMFQLLRNALICVSIQNEVGNKKRQLSKHVSFLVFKLCRKILTLLTLNTAKALFNG